MRQNSNVQLLGFFEGLLRGLRRLLIGFGVACLVGPALWLMVFPPPCLICSVRPDGRPRVLLIGIDGLTVRALGTGNTPVLDALIQRSAFTLTAQNVMPTASSPNWASLLMGAPPEGHRIRDNRWRPEDHADQALCGRKTGAGWPTIFELLETQQPEAHSVIVHDWIGILRFVPRQDVDTRRFTHVPWYTHYIARRQLAKEPDLMFVHYDHTDGAGHSHGYDSWQYLRAVSQVDRYVGDLLADLDRQGRRDEVTVMIVSDHGATRFGHGGNSPKERTIPWIMAGPGVVAGEIKAPVTIQDTAPTIAGVLGLTPPECWSGRIVGEAFISE